MTNKTISRQKLKLEEKDLHTVVACAAALNKIAQKHNKRASIPAARLNTILKDIIAGQTVLSAVTEPPKFNAAGDMSALAYAAFANGDIEDALKHQIVAWQFEDAPTLYHSIVQCNDEADVSSEDLGGEPIDDGEMTDDEDEPDHELDDTLEDFDEEDYPDDEENPEDLDVDFDNDEDVDLDDPDAMLEDEDDDVIIPNREPNGDMDEGEPLELPEADEDYENGLNEAVDNVVASYMDNDGDNDDNEATGNHSSVNPIENVNEDTEQEIKEKQSGSLIKGDPVMASVIKKLRKTEQGRAIILAANRLSSDGSKASRKKADIFLKRAVNLI